VKTELFQNKTSFLSRNALQRALDNPKLCDDPEINRWAK